MGAPYFQLRALERDVGLIALYGDMSDRMMSLAAGLGHNQEVYPIDESFADLSGRSCLLLFTVYLLANPWHAPSHTRWYARRIQK